MENRYYKIEDLPIGVMDLVKTECGDRYIVPTNIRELRDFLSDIGGEFEEELEDRNYREIYKANLSDINGTGYSLEAHAMIYKGHFSWEDGIIAIPYTCECETGWAVDKHSSSCPEMIKLFGDVTGEPTPKTQEEIYTMLRETFHSKSGAFLNKEMCNSLASVIYHTANIKEDE